jgi:hypothetical protein
VARLLDRDASDALYVVSVLHVGLGNTLVRPGTCSVTAIKLCIENYDVDVVVIVVVL